MLETSTIAACILAVSGTAALAQTGWVPPGPNNPPAGAGGRARVCDIGSPTPQRQRHARLPDRGDRIGRVRR